MCLVLHFYFKKCVVGPEFNPLSLRSHILSSQWYGPLSHQAAPEYWFNVLVATGSSGIEQKSNNPPLVHVEALLSFGWGDYHEILTWICRCRKKLYPWLQKFMIGWSIQWQSPTIHTHHFWGMLHLTRKTSSLKFQTRKLQTKVKLMAEKICNTASVPV